MKKNRNSIHKRIVSMIIAIVIIGTNIPVSEISNYAKYILNEITAYADELKEEKQSEDYTELSEEHIIDDIQIKPEKIDTLQESEEDGYKISENNVNITSYTGLTNYSKKYNENPETYCNYDITFTFQNTNIDSTSTETEEFIPIGTAKYPFRGNIKITSVNENKIPLKVPMFDYICDTSKMIVSGSDEAKELIIYRNSDNNNSPLFANNVVKSDEVQQTNQSKWIIGVYKDSHNFAGIIGNIGEGSKVDLQINNEAVTESYKKNESTGNTGLVCGDMEENSELTVSYTFNSGTKLNTIQSTEGHAGGLVGEMKSGSKLIINSNIEFPSDVTIKAGYAGGLVGYATDATIEFGSYKVVSKVEGATATGGIFGCYTNTQERTFSNYNAECNVIGYTAGGVFGELKNNQKITFDESNNIITERNTGNTTDYGGLIGKYSSENSSCELNICGNEDKNLSVTVRKSGTVNNYGGIIGISEGNSYISCSYVNVIATQCNSYVTAFGGFIGNSGSGMLNVNNFTVSTDGNTGFLGGGVIGNMSAGCVLQLSGYTDLSATKCNESGKGKYGQIIGIRGNQTLVYALNEWKLIRSTTPVKADDIGTWGEVLRFNNDNFKLENVLNIDETNHTVTINSITVGDNNTVTVSNVAEFAIVSLNLKSKEKNDNSYALKFYDYTKLLNNIYNPKLNLTINGDINLTGTGLTGLYRDDGCNAVGVNSVHNFNGTIKGADKENGEKYTITMATGEPYGYRKDASGTEQQIALNDTSDGNGKIYCHRYEGLITKICGEATLKNLKIDGKIIVEPKGAGNNKEMFIGSFSAQNVASNKVDFDNIEACVTMDLGTSDSGITTKCGGLIGEFYFDCKVDIKDSIIYPKIEYKKENTNDVIIGGVLGRVLQRGLTINVTNTTVSAEVENTGNKKDAKAGGFIALIDGLNNENRNITLKDVAFNGIKISGSDKASLLGSQWNNVNITFTSDTNNVGVVFNDCKLSGGNIYAGLVTEGSGYWKVDKLAINNITVDSGNANSFGMFVNYGYSNTSGYESLYLEFTNENAYKIENDSLTLSKVNYFDEILVYAHKDKIKAVEGNCSVVSIHTTNGIINMDGTTCNTYQNQTNYLTDNKDKINNPYVRYYYNLDTMRKNPDKDAEKLLVWSVNRYAHDSIKKYFKVSSFENIADDKTTYVIPSGTYDMKGYSYYPVDIADTVTIGDSDNTTSIIFYNNEFDNLQGDERLTYNNDNQHYQMHNGLFRNFSGNVTMNNISLGGNVGKIGVATSKTGAIICGNMSGSIQSPAELNCNGLILDGIFLNGSDSVTDYTYAPLIINTINSNSKLKLKDVSTTNKYNIDDSTRLSAGCLIGNVGYDDKDGTDNIKLVFNKIKLDSRKSRFGNGMDTAFDNAYNTKKSIFKNATILNAYAFPTGKNCSAVYNYKYEEDWDENGNPVHNVTYGKEITDSKEYRENDISLENKYLNSSVFTNPKDSNSTESYDFNTDKFLPYVKDYKSVDTGYTFHEIKVNVPSPNFDEGCGTYNDPYIISNEKQLNLLSDFNCSDGTIINYNNNNNNNYNSWCDSHVSYIKSDDKFYPMKEDGEADKSQEGIDVSKMEEILSTAYFKINNDITLGKDFKGIGKDSSFMGVIYGNNHTITNNNTVPFIYDSKGSVINNLNLVINISDGFTISSKDSLKYETDDGECQFYGGLIGIVNGGDNIIDNVNVTFNGADKIKVSGTYNSNVAIGGYIGVVRYGGVIFRNMKSNAGITKEQNDKFNTENKSYLYCNSIIGRVIDGYALTESDEYRPCETYVTMKNGTKNYSIADIDKNSNNKITFKKIDNDILKVSVSDAQSLFLMGCITMSGAGKCNSNGIYDNTNGIYDNTNQLLYGYGNNQMARHGNYSSVDNNDFNINIKYDSYSNDVIPYIIYKYTDKYEEDYPARTFTYNRVFDIELTGDNYVLPDGFRGIGSLNDSQYEYTTDNINTILQSNEYSQMKIRNIEGNNATICLNMSLYSYGDSAYERNFVSGLGLFNTLLQNCNEENNGVIRDFTITGNIKAEKYDTSGNPQYKDDFLHIGGLAGTTFGYNKCDIKINNVKVDNLKIESGSSHSSGGLIGYLRNNSESAFSAENCNASSVTANSYRHAGGLIGYTYNYTTNIEKIKIENVNSEIISNEGDWATLLNCVGGVIGGTHNKSHKLNDIEVIGGTISANGVNVSAGGLIGATNNDIKTSDKSDVEYTISDITVRGVSIDTKSAKAVYSGGLIGTMRNSNNATCNISGCRVIGNDNTIKGTCISAGLIGVDCQKTNIDNCSVEGYDIECCTYESNPCGGLIAKVQNQNTTLTNSYIKNCNINYTGDNNNNKCIGGIAGYCDSSVTLAGYNIALNNINISSNDMSVVGTAIGELNDSKASVKFVGVSVSDINLNNKEYLNSFGNYNGEDSYVICSDMKGVCLSSDKQNTIYSPINHDNSTLVLDSPYAPINPKTVIGSDETFFLTGDGVSIDIQEVLKNNNDFAEYKSKLSTFAKEMGINDFENDFPVLVVNESDKEKLTNMINTYIRIITNTNNVNVNYAEDNQLFKVVISQYVYDETKTFKNNTKNQSLEKSGNYFQMTNKHYDNANNQFTLVDVQYKNPLDNEKIVYHLYIPVVVEKMLKFDFNAKIRPGTTYKSDVYENDIVMENYGSPVTAYIEYSYNRTIKEWNDAINSGENILKSYDKFILFNYTSETTLNGNTDLVLVDCNNGGKAYYSKLSECWQEDTKKMNFRKFEDNSGELFNSVSFYDILNKSANITAVKNEDGKGNFIKCTENEATLKAVCGDEIFYFKIKDSEENVETYNIEINSNNDNLTENDIIPVKERYYLSIFTFDNNTESGEMQGTDSGIVQVVIKSDRRLGDENMTPSQLENHKPSTMIVGNIYTQVLSFRTSSTDGTINQDNSTINVEELKTTISINHNKDDTLKKAIQNNMQTINFYHGFVIDMNIHDADGNRNGIYGNPQIMGKYCVNDTEYDIKSYVSDSVITITENDNTDAVKIALQGDGTANISCSNLAINYYELKDINDQFPLRPEKTDYGTSVVAKSNIAYDNPDNIKNSNTSVKEGDKYNIKYHLEGNLKIASLNYNVDAGTADADKFASLGVNGRVSDEYISAVGYYDVSDMSDDSLTTAEKLFINIELQQKNQNGEYQKVDISDYLENFIFNIGNDTINYNGKENTIEYDISDIPVDKIFSINTSFNVITGEKFEESGHLYSNYKLIMNVSLCNNQGETISNSSAVDYIVYTNAKIFTEFLSK